MKINDISLTYHTSDIGACRDFYVKYFGAKVTFDCGWYATVQFKSDVNPHLFLSFMNPQSNDEAIANGGTTLNIMVEDVDAEYANMKTTGIKIVEEISDKDWGDRSFSVKDPLGNVLYVYSPREIKGEYLDAVVKQ